MVQFRVISPSLIKDRLKQRFKLLKIAFLSLTYNDHMSWNYVFDTLMEPLFWFVDSFTKILGPLFVTGVIILTFSGVFIAYYVGLPYYLEHKNGIYTTFVVLLGQYIKLNIVFYYWHAYFTPPGKVPDNTNMIKTVTTICKKCISPKPPRTHHCSVCDKCVLKMDHHCPWINGCIGHFNHRYFFLYMASMVVGCFFIMLFGIEIFYDEVMNKEGKDEQFQLLDERNLIFYEAFVITGTFFILGGLMLWHAKMIHNGETSIEAHINQSEVKRLHKLGKKYRNAYNFTPWYNWCLFLGMIDGRGWMSVFVPFKFRPKGDGLEWDTVYSCDIKWNDNFGFQSLDPSKLA
jgi:palmitoyltransferase